MWVLLGHLPKRKFFNVSVLPVKSDLFLIGVGDIGGSTICIDGYWYSSTRCLRTCARSCLDVQTTFVIVLKLLLLRILNSTIEIMTRSTYLRVIIAYSWLNVLFVRILRCLHN